MAPDKIYTDNRGVYAKLPIFSQIDANVEYIRKEALLEWANNWKQLGQNDDFMHAIETLVRHLNSM